MKILVGGLANNEINNISSFLQRNGDNVDFVATVVDARERIRLYEYDCLLLEEALFGKEIFSLIIQLVDENKNDGIIVLTGTSDFDKVKALNLGADDIITFPQSNEELTARMRAVVRRKKYQTKSKIYFGNLVIDINQKTVFVWNNAVNLTKTEYDILLYLISNKSRVVSKVTLSEYIWGDSSNEIDSFDTLFAHIKNLRKKLKHAKAEVDFKSIYGVGYHIIEL